MTSKYVIESDTVRDCMQRLIDESIHRLFPGYLCLKQQSGFANRTDELSFPYHDFFNAYLRLRDTDKPYYIPFTQAESPDKSELWYNKNVSGTYAPSSLRSTSPLLQVVEIQEGGHNAKWRLQQEHWKLARHHLAADSHVPAESLAAFLFRDYAIKTDDPGAYELVSMFADDFGYELGGKQFTHLYETGDSDITADSFEKI